MSVERIALMGFIVLALLLLPFYVYVIIRFAGEAISKTMKFFKEEEITTKNKEK